MSLAAADALIGVFGMKRVKSKKCAQCRCEFQPQRMGQKVCSPACAQELAKKKREKVEKAQDRQKRESLKSKAEWAKEAQSSVNAYIRIRDELEPCISCGRHHKGQYHAGHYLSRGAHPELRFDERNIHKQCQPCNTHLSGNQIEYRKGLIKRYGIEYVNWLEGPHSPKNYTIEDLKAIKAFYVAKLKEIRNG